MSWSNHINDSNFDLGLPDIQFSDNNNFEQNHFFQNDYSFNNDNNFQDDNFSVSLGNDNNFLPSEKLQQSSKAVNHLFHTATPPEKFLTPIFSSSNSTTTTTPSSNSRKRKMGDDEWSTEQPEKKAKQLVQKSLNDELEFTAYELESIKIGIITQDILKKIKDSTYLKSIFLDYISKNSTIIFDQITFKPNNDLQEFFKFLSESINKITISLSSCDNINFFVKTLGSNPTIYQNVEHLYIDPMNFNMIGNTGILFMDLARVSKLTLKNIVKKTDPIFYHFITSLRNSNLKEVYFDGLDLSSIQTEKLIEVIPYTKLEKIDFSLCKEAAKEKIQEALTEPKKYGWPEKKQIKEKKNKKNLEEDLDVTNDFLAGEKPIQNSSRLDPSKKFLIAPTVNAPNIAFEDGEINDIKKGYITTSVLEKIQKSIHLQDLLTDMFIKQEGTFLSFDEIDFTKVETSVIRELIDNIANYKNGLELELLNCENIRELFLQNVIDLNKISHLIIRPINLSQLVRRLEGDSLRWDGKFNVRQFFTKFNNKTISKLTIEIADGKRSHPNIFQWFKEVCFKKQNSLQEVQLLGLNVSASSLNEFIQNIPYTKLKKFAVVRDQKIPVDLQRALEAPKNDGPPPEKPKKVNDNSFHNDITFRKYVEPSLNSEGYSKIPDSIHYFLFDFNLDAIPAILDSLKEKYWNSLQMPEMLGKKVRFTIITPKNQPPKTSATINKTTDEGIDKGIKKYLHEKGHEYKETTIDEFKKSFTPNANEMAIYIGETVSCGATSTYTMGSHGIAGDGSDGLTKYHLEHLEMIKEVVRPDVIISENHTFPYEVQAKIRDILNKDKLKGYHIQYETIHHAALTNEYRERIYLVATSSFIKRGMPEHLYDKISGKKIRSLEEISQEASLFESPADSQKKLSSDVLRNFAAALTLSKQDPDIQVIVYANKLTLQYKGKRYWLKAKKNKENYDLYSDSFAFINPDSQDIRLAKIEMDKHTATWMQTRFFHKGNPKVCRTISSIDLFGTNIWGKELAKLTDYAASRVHGCPKWLSKIVHENFQRINQLNSANSYIGHAYSTKVVAPLLVSTMYKVARHTLPYETKSYPQKIPFIETKHNNEWPDIESHYQSGSQLQITGRDIFLVDQNGHKMTSEMHWIELEPEMSKQFAVDEMPQESIAPSELPLSAIQNPEVIKKKIEQGGFEALRHQLEGISWFLSQRIEGKKGGILGDDMGLGKTLQASVYCSLILDEMYRTGVVRPILIIIPLSLRSNWEEHLSKFVDRNRIHFLQGIKDFPKNVKDILSKDIFIATQNFVSTHADLLKKIPFDSIITDEAHEIRNPDTVLSQKWKSLSADFRLCLTGTPLQNSLIDLANQLTFINPDLEISLDKNAIEAETEKLNLLMAEYLLRRTKNEIKLKEKRYVQYDCELSEIQHKIVELIKSHPIFSKKQFGRLTFLQEVCIHPKILNSNAFDEIIKNLNADEVNKINQLNFPKVDVVIEILKERFKNPQKSNEVRYDPGFHRPVVIFSRFNEALKILAEKINQSAICGVFVSTVIADTPAKNFDKIIKDFNQGNIPVLLLNLKKGVGLNLQRADAVILLEPWWNPRVEAQAEDRVYRLGQDRDVTIYKIFMHGSLEKNNVLPVQEKKNQLSRDFIDAHNVNYAVEEENDINEELKLEDMEVSDDEGEVQETNTFARALSLEEVYRMEVFDS